MFGSQTFLPISWMFEEQAVVSHSSTESEEISLGTGFQNGHHTKFTCVDCVQETHSNSSAEGNFTRQGSERHSQFHSDKHMSSDMVNLVNSNIPDISLPDRLYIF